VRLLWPYIHRFIGPDTWRIGAGEATPEQIEEMSLTTGDVERLPRDIAAAIAAYLPAPPRHQRGGDALSIEL